MQPSKVRQAETITAEPRADGDMDAVVVRIRDTGPKEARCADRYRHVIRHNLGRVPVGVQIIKTSGACGIYIVGEDSSTVTVKFTESRCDVNVRIW